MNVNENVPRFLYETFLESLNIVLNIKYVLYIILYGVATEKLKIH